MNKYRHKKNGRLFLADDKTIPNVEFFETSEDFERVEDEPVKAPAKKTAAKRTTGSRTRKAE